MSPSSESTANVNSHPQQSKDLVSIEEDIARISSIISPEHNTEHEEEISASNLAELLKQLESANGAMDGVESKLDGVLGQLDSLLEALEKKDTTETSETEIKKK
ncbi:hypothetical protein V5O48_006943 [Marasmius crinis-equi]|uniref:Uncharacterized protein n=1 Tax=Marasmius crinis-equi TaxID=585013 RepID=A0ABR3FI43_9AGAR